MSDDSGRKSREEIAGSTGDKKSTPLGGSRKTGCGEERKIPQPETLADSATSDHRSRSGAIQTTTNGRLDCPHSTEKRASRGGACLEWMTCLSCGARWSRKTGGDDIQVKTGLTSVDTSLTDDKQNGDVLRMQPVSPMQKSGKHISYNGITCFTVCALVFGSSAHGGATQSDRKRASERRRFQPHQNNNSYWNSRGIFRLLALRVRKHDGPSFECFQTNSRRSR